MLSDSEEDADHGGEESSKCITSLDVPVSPLKPLLVTKLERSTPASSQETIAATSSRHPTFNIPLKRAPLFAKAGSELQKAMMSLDGCSDEMLAELRSNIPAMIVSQTAEESQIPVPTIQNIVSTCNLAVALDLKHLAMHARNAEYNPKRFAAVIMRIREPRTTALIFASGKMVVTGAKSEEASRLAARKYARIVQKLGPKVKFLDFKLQNIVGSVDVRFAIQLEGLFITHNQFSTYEPELFPGLIYRMVNPRVVFLIFVSGKVVITGARTREDIDTAFEQIYPVVKGFKK